MEKLVNHIKLAKAPVAAADDFWVLARSACYLGGRGVTFGPPLLQAAAINPGVYSIPVSLERTPGVVGMDKSLGIFADGSLDHVLVTPMIEASPDPRVVLEDAARKLKLGGHLILLTDVNRQGPGLVVFNPTDTKALVAQLAKWRVKCDHEERGKHLLVLKKIEGRRGLETPVRQQGKKRACIARYGAIGDAIVMSPLVHQLADDGYEVTLNISSYCAPVFENNPYITNLLIQERDIIPNALLGRYWDFWASQYDKYINLSESMEGDLLMVEGRPEFFTPKAWRHSVANHNYSDWVMQRAGYPTITGKRGELYFTNAEERRAAREFSQWIGKFTIAWALNGSSKHKIFPMLEATLREWFARHPDSVAITTGGADAQLLEFGHYQLVPRAGRWSLRESLIATKYASCVVGPETMMTNAAGCFTTPKIVLLSHSTRENLTKYFLNDHSLEPDQAVAPCYPCHSLHYTLESCPIGEMTDHDTGVVLGRAPICATAIDPGRVLAELEAVYANWHASRRAAGVA